MRSVSAKQGTRWRRKELKMLFPSHSFLGQSKNGEISINVDVSAGSSRKVEIGIIFFMFLSIARESTSLAGGRETVDIDNVRSYIIYGVMDLLTIANEGAEEGKNKGNCGNFKREQDL